MIHRGEERTNGIRCRFNPSIGINFQAAKISSEFYSVICYLDVRDHHWGRLI